MFHVEHSKQIIMNTTENKLIAEFMDYEIKGSEFIYPDSMLRNYSPQSVYEMESGVYEFSCDITSMEFHTSFDWLMPVALRILSAEFCLECADKDIHPWKDAKGWIDELKLSLQYGIEPLYKAVVAFIVWYNEQ